MSDTEQKDKNRALHELMENEFQQLVDIIEQKKIVHEDIELQDDDQPDLLTRSAHELHRQSQELGADTLAEFFNELEHSARHGDIREASELLENINSEFEKVKDILSKG